MIAEYKFYHGAVLAELVNDMDRAISIDELEEEGRLSSYILDNKIGLQIKHSTNRLSPWQFTFTKQNLLQLLTLQTHYKVVFLAFVCHDDGMVTLTLEEATSILTSGETEQAWIRIERRRNEWYTVSGGAAELPNKKPQGIQPLIQALSVSR
jgi:hypothetical protein